MNFFYSNKNKIMSEILLIEMPHDEFMRCWYNPNIELKKQNAQNVKTIRKLQGEKRKLLNKIRRLKKLISEWKEKYYSEQGAMKTEQKVETVEQKVEETIEKSTEVQEDAYYDSESDQDVPQDVTKE